MPRMCPSRRLSDLPHPKVPLQIKRCHEVQGGAKVSQAPRGVLLLLRVLTRGEVAHADILPGDVEAHLQASQLKRTEVLFKQCC
jgi:hypothetical protein